MFIVKIYYRPRHVQIPDAVRRGGKICRSGHLLDEITEAALWARRQRERWLSSGSSSRRKMQPISPCSSFFYLYKLPDTFGSRLSQIVLGPIVPSASSTLSSAHRWAFPEKYSSTARITPGCQHANGALPGRLSRHLFFVRNSLFSFVTRASQSWPHRIPPGRTLGSQARISAIVWVWEWSPSIKIRSKLLSSNLKAALVLSSEIGVTHSVPLACSTLCSNV